MKGFGFGLVASMESVDEEVTGDNAEVAQTAAEVAEGTVELVEDSSEIGAVAAQVEDAAVAGDQLEEIAEVASEAVESGEGLDESAAEMASIAIESIRNRIGIRGEARIVPVAESFGNSNTRVASTKLVLEGIGDTLKRIWAAIKAAVLRVWEAVKSFLAKLFNSTTLLSKHIEALRQRARALPAGAQPAEKKIKHAGVARAIGLKGKANLETARQVGENTLALVAVAGEVSKSTSAIVDAAVKLAGSQIDEAAVKAYLSSGSNAADAVGKALHNNFKLASTVFGSGFLNAASKKGLQTKTKGDVTTEEEHYGPFVGSTVLTLKTWGRNAGALSTKNYSMSFSTIPAEKQAEEVDALNGGDVQIILKEASELVNGLADFKKTQGNYDAITKQVQKVADTVLNNASKVIEKTGSSTETRLGLAELKDDVQTAIATMNSFGNRAPALVFQLAKAYADYASVALRNLREQ